MFKSFGRGGGGLGVFKSFGRGGGGFIVEVEGFACLGVVLGTAFCFGIEPTGVDPNFGGLARSSIFFAGFAMAPGAFAEVLRFRENVGSAARFARNSSILTLRAASR